MDSVLKFDKVVLTKEFDNKLKKVGEIFEIANILDDLFLLRDTKERAAVGVISFKDFEKYFVKKENFKGWTNWTKFVGFDEREDVFYRTNGKKVQVRFLTDKVRAEASCNLKYDDEFNLFFGLQIAYLRCCNKLMNNKKEAYEKEVNRLDSEIRDNSHIIEKMISSLEAKTE